MTKEQQIGKNVTDRVVPDRLQKDTEVDRPLGGVMTDETDYEVCQTVVLHRK